MRFCANWQVNLREHWLWAAHLEFNTVQRSVGAANQVQLLGQVVYLHCALCIEILHCQLDCRRVAE